MIPWLLVLATFIAGGCSGPKAAIDKAKEARIIQREMGGESQKMRDYSAGKVKPKPTNGDKK